MVGSNERTCLRLVFLVCFPILVAWLPGCGPTSEIKIDGSSTVLPISEAVAEEFAKSNGDVQISVKSSGTGGGFQRFALGEIDIAGASRPIKESEREACAAKGIEFLELTIAYDGIPIVVNPANTWCECLTVDQLKSLWQPQSNIHTWSDLDPSWPEERIILFGPATASGTFDYFTAEIVGEEGQSRSDYQGHENDNNLVRGVAEERNGLGYFGFAYYEQNKESLKLLGVDSGDGAGCVKPSRETILTKEYRPLSRPLFIYVAESALARAEVVQFVQFYLEHGGQLATEVGYVPLSEEVSAESRQRLDVALEEVAGTTSQ